MVQLFALATPIVFHAQIIDKVFAHHNLSTLDITRVRLAVVSLFRYVARRRSRTYLMSHTSNRVDVELGMRLFHTTDARTARLL
ncbi:MAG: hypothetical protein M5U09_11850 [Gammaproteobacteria bacterium]|nr:hypothetical protein [Gammaproteobacteria bacterium]